MFFRNLTLFRFPSTLDVSAIAELLQEHQLKPVGPLEMSSRGFVSPLGRDHADVLSHRLGDFLWLAVGGQDRMLPGSVVADALAKRIDEVAEKEGRRPGGRTRKRLKDEVLLDLLPRAFVKTSRVDALLDLQHGYIAVDTASRKAAEGVASEIRNLLGSFPALPLNAEVAPRAVLTGWVAGNPLPAGLSIGEECQLADPVQGGAVVNCKHQELRGDEIAKHLEAGKQVTRLALKLDDTIAGVIGDDLTVRKLRFLDGAVDKLDASDAEGVRAELEARFAVMSAELRRLFCTLEAAFSISNAEV
ncbi:recombination-associated protein RdgC [Xanthomonas sp. LMG 8992]|uniref:recombination-associated protein RdgC n=1 Tax=Xanthomonas sp. LMG 8992 TaxID=1591157 RepID=UPI00136ECAB5|nr:recombination-associated protein RdgC [Xanthomonas sp. LMG 8992]MXV11661.1 recombination-associated protein RdgC [Xanthomonas sp. LMG 8992]